MQRCLHMHKNETYIHRWDTETWEFVITPTFSPLVELEVVLIATYDDKVGNMTIPSFQWSRYSLHGNRNVTLTKLSTLAAEKFAIFPTFGAVSGEISSKWYFRVDQFHLYTAQHQFTLCFFLSPCLSFFQYICRSIFGRKSIHLPSSFIAHSLCSVNFKRSYAIGNLVCLGPLR